MSPQISHLRGCIVKLVAFVWFFPPNYVFSKVLSNCLPVKRQSRIGCICSTFFRCVFSNVTSKHFSKRMQRHIVCTSMSFLHCVLSNVFSNPLQKRMHHHTGCIWKHKREWWNKKQIQSNRAVNWWFIWKWRKVNKLTSVSASSKAIWGDIWKPTVEKMKQMQPMWHSHWIWYE